jgi:hypothetical protein
MNEVVIFEKALRAAVPSRPNSSLGAELVPRLAQAARDSTLELEDQATRRVGQRSHGGPGRARRAWVARVAIVVAALPLLFAGLAFAGAKVPNPVQSAFDSVGVHLPNQPGQDQAVNRTRKSSEEPSQSRSATSSDHSRGSHPGAKRGQNQTAEGKPGRRVRRHGTGPVPGPASPPAGKALGHAKPPGNSHNSSGASDSTASPGNSGNAPGHSGAQGGGASNGHGKPG